MHTLKEHEQRVPYPRRWETPAIRVIGSISDVVKQGGGKLSIMGGDPGESRKQLGTG